MRSTGGSNNEWEDEAKERQREDRRGYRGWGYGVGVRLK